MEWMDPVQGQVATGDRGEGSYLRMSYVNTDRNPSDIREPEPPSA